MPKKALRRELLTRRRGMDLHNWRSSSHAAQQRLISMTAFTQSSCIALYAAIQHEVDTDELFETALQHGKQVLFPVVCGNRLQFRRTTSREQLSHGAFGILEPCLLEPEHQLETADLIVVPGVAFDLQGHRIGFGKGYYDHCLSELSERPLLIGLCHDFQLLEQLPAEGHDIRMQYVVTDQRIIEVGTGCTPD